MKLAELRASLREMLDDETKPYLWPDSTLDRYLNNAVREACIRARLLKDDADSLPEICALTFDAGQSRLSYRPEILVIRSGSIDGHHLLWALTADSMDRQEHHWMTHHERGTPRYMVMDLSQKTIRLHPTPDIPGTLRLRVWRTPLDRELMSKPDMHPVIHLPDPEELRHWAAHEAYLKKDAETFDAAASGTALSLFEQRFGSRPSLHEMARWADSPPRVRHVQTF